LTLAKKKGPEAIVFECDRALEIFEEKGYPDSWHTWKMAKYDAETQILFDKKFEKKEFGILKDF
jgi:hypothetical protein